MGDTRVSSCRWTTRLFTSDNVLFLVFSIPKRNSAGMFYFCRRSSGKRKGGSLLRTLYFIFTFVVYFFLFGWVFLSLLFCLFLILRKKLTRRGIHKIQL